MDNENIEQLISTLIVFPTDNILGEISKFLLKAQNHDLNSLISTFFQSLLTLENWSWEILSRDTRKWHDEEQEYFQLFSNLSSFNRKLILSNNDINVKESLLLPANTEILDKIFQQIEKRNDENDRFLSIIILWFDTLALLIHEHIELTSNALIIYLNERIISDIFMNDQFKIYLQQLNDPCPFITMKQLFYTKTSLFYLTGYFNSKPNPCLYNGQQIIEYLAEDYTNILLIHSQTLSSWSKELLGCITHLIGLLTVCHWWIGIDDRILQKFIIPTKTLWNYIQSLIDILSYRLFHEQIDQQCSNNETILIENILELFQYYIHFQDIKNFFREQRKFLETLGRFNSIKNDRILLFTYRLQSELLSEKEIKQLNIAKNINELFFYYLQQASTNPLKKYKNISIEELLKGLFILFTNDALKDTIVNFDQLIFLIDLSEHYTIIYDILWSLSFDIRLREQLLLNSTFINKLNNNSTNESIQKIIHGIKWNLNRHDKQNKIINISSEKKFDIMLSYSHKNRLICTQIYNDLISNGYRVWIDFNQIHDNEIDAMVQAIEQSRMVIICMSEQYKRSNSCRAQLQYAFKRQVKILPILIGKYYQPDGWLLFLIGNLSYVDFTKHEHSHAIQLVLNQLKNPLISVIDSLVVRQQPQNITNLSASNIRSTDIRQWTKDDVQQWLKSNELLHLAEVLSDSNGSDLIYLSKLVSNNSPEENLKLFQEDAMKRTGKNLSLIEIARLHTLLDEQIHIPVKAKKWDSKNCCRMM